MRVLVVGGAGFLGSHLVERSLDRGDEVHVLVRGATDRSRLSRWSAQVQVHVSELADPAGLGRCFARAQPEVVYHLATQTRWAPTAGLDDAAASVRVDLLNLISLLGAAAAAPTPPQVLVRAGTLAEYGSGPTPFVEEQREQPQGCYAAAMTACTHYTQMLQPRLPFRVLTARLALIYGPGQDGDYLIPTLLENCARGRVTRLERPDDRRDYIHVRDVCDGLLALAASDLPGGTILNLATGDAPTVREVASQVAAVIGVDPALIEVGGGAPGPGNPCVHGSAAQARARLGWEARVGLEAGLAELWEHVRGTLEAKRS